MSFHKLIEPNLADLSRPVSAVAVCERRVRRSVQSEQDRRVSRRTWRGQEGTEQRSSRLQNNPGLPKQIGTRLQFKCRKVEPQRKESIPPDLPA